MGLRAGLLTETVCIEKPCEASNEYGATARVWRLAFLPTRAQVTFNSGSRVDENNEIFHTCEVTFTIRRYHKVDGFMRIVWKDRYYRILSIEDDRARQLQRIRAELVNE